MKKQGGGCFVLVIPNGRIKNVESLALYIRKGRMKVKETIDFFTGLMRNKIQYHVYTTEFTVAANEYSGENIF